MAQAKIEYECKVFNGKNKGVIDKILIEPMVKNAYPFWEAEIYPSTESIFYRLVFAFSARGRNFNTRAKEFNNWNPNKLEETNNCSTMINENFNKFPNRDEYNKIQYSIGRKRFTNYVNLDVKIQSNKQAEGIDKEKFRISLDIHIYDNGTNNTLEEVLCHETDAEYEIINKCCSFIPASLNQLNELMEACAAISKKKKIGQQHDNFSKMLLSCIEAQNNQEDNKENYFDSKITGDENDNREILCEADEAPHQYQLNNTTATITTAATTSIKFSNFPDEAKLSPFYNTVKTFFPNCIKKEENDKVLFEFEKEEFDEFEREHCSLQ